MLISIFFIENFAYIYDGVFDISKRDYEFDDSSTEKMLPYVDSSCDFTVYDMYGAKNIVDKSMRSNTNLSYYPVTSGKIQCHNRIIESDANYQRIENDSSNTFNIGIGLFEDFENIKRSFLFSLVFLAISSFYQRPKKYLNFDNFWRLNVAGIVYCMILGINTTNSFIYFFTSIFLPILFQLNLLNLIFNLFNRDSTLLTLYSISIFPFLFFNLSFSFFTAFSIVFFINNGFSKKVMKTTLVIYMPLIFSFLINIREFYFVLPSGYDYSSLVLAGDFQNTIVNEGDGFKSIIHLINWLTIIYLGVSIFYEESINQRFVSIIKSFLNGFVLWSLVTFLSIHSPYFYFQTTKIFGIPKMYDLEKSFMWTGINTGYEMTSFWLTIIIIFSTFMIVEQKKYIFILHWALAFYLNLINGSRTLFIFYLMFLVAIISFSIFEKFKVSYLFVILLFFIFNQLTGETSQRVVEKTIEASCDQVLTSQLINSTERVGRELNISTLDLTFKQILKEKTELHSQVLDIVNFSACKIGRQVEWARYLILTDFEGPQYAFGHGFGQSYEILIYEIEKPHSLYLTMFYQVGLFGLIYYSVLGFSILKKKFINLNSIEFYKISIFVLILLNAIKTEFLFIYWGTIFSFFLGALVITEEKSKQKINI